MSTSKASSRPARAPTATKSASVVPSGSKEKQGSQAGQTSISSKALEGDSFKAHRGQGCDITWNNLTVSVVNKAKKGLLHRCKRAKRNEPEVPKERVVLRDIYGSARSGETLAIMGSSGAGKSTLLNVLTNIDQQDIKKDPNSVILVNGEVVSASQMRVASSFVQQVDVFIGTLTVEEQLRYSAALRMDPKKFPSKERAARVQHLLTQMNLEKCRKTVIGAVGIRKGISVGEKKRLAFACELLTNPDFFFCDEPTSGLDSFMAVQVANVLHEVAKKDNKCVITTIHQPSDEVFQLFDKVCFLSREKDEGRVVFFGRPAEVVPFLTKISRSFDAQKRAHQIHKEDHNDSDEENELVCSPKTGPAEHAMRIISRTTSDNDQSFENRVHFIRQEFEKTQMGAQQKTRAAKSSDFANPAANKELKKKSTYPVSWFKQTAVLFRRSMKTIIRDPVLLQVRFIQIILTAFVIGIINWQTPITGPTITNLEGILYNCPRDMNFMFLFPSIHVITSEFPIMAREYRAGIYSASAYYVGKSLAELPQYTVLPLLYSTIIYWMAGFQRSAVKFLIFCTFNVLQSWTAISVAYAGACIFGSEDLATTYVPMVVLPMLFTASHKTPRLTCFQFDAIPLYFNWISYASWFRYGFEGLEVNQWADIGDITGCEWVVGYNQSHPYNPYTLEETDYCPAANGEGLLDRRDLYAGHLLRDGLLLAAIVLVARFLGLFALVLRMRLRRG
ncbi:ABC transporter ATP-binding protein/permease wht-1 [Aphelenchoides fujianensis]|nr:ABC transporter ATP-binding protein/permease wht-1 [Aphelenchoides fujianensis]